MPVSLTKYQIPTTTSSLPTPPPAWLAPSSTNKPHPTPLTADHHPASAPYVHAQLLDTPPLASKPSFLAQVRNRRLLPSLLTTIRENPLTQPIPSANSDSNGHHWKIQAGIALVSFFLGAVVAVILMLYLY